MCTSIFLYINQKCATQLITLYLAMLCSIMYNCDCIIISCVVTIVMVVISWLPNFPCYDKIVYLL